jgi:hypothetical protein
MGPYSRQTYRPLPRYPGNPILVARLPPDEWQSVRDYAEQYGVTISDLVREGLALRGVINHVITPTSAHGEISADAPLSQPPQQPPSGSATGQLLSMAEALAAGHYDKPPPNLRDVRPAPYSSGRPLKLPRSKVRPYDRVAEQARRTGPKPPPTLIDRGRGRP